MELGPNQKRWINELKSGNYNQCFGRLFRWTEDLYPSFCCLGVAKVVLNLTEADPYDLTNSYRNLGLRDADGTLHCSYISKSGSIFRSLTALNDTSGMSFKEIAEYIEANPKNVFAESK